MDSILGKLDRLIYKAIGLRNRPDLSGWQYVRAILISNLLMGIFVFLILMLQPMLPLNPTGVGSVSWDVALHTTISFLTNTDQQHYSGETALSYGSQVFALGFLHLSTSVLMLMGRYIPIVALLLLAEGMARKQPVPMTDGTLRTDTGLFTSITGVVILILGVLTFLPVLALGPIAEAFQIGGS